MNWTILLQTKTTKIGLVVIAVGLSRTAWPDLLPWDEILTVILGGAAITLRDAIAKIEAGKKDQE